MVPNTCHLPALPTGARYIKNLTVSVIVNNVFNKIKYDYRGGWPNYPVGSFNPFGRQGWVEVNYKFGA